MNKDDPIAMVKDLLSDDALVCSDSDGVRNVQGRDFIFIDDEVISGSFIVEYVDPGLKFEPFSLKENDTMIQNLELEGIVIPEELLDGLFPNDLRDFNDYEGNS